MDQIINVWKNCYIKIFMFLILVSVVNKKKLLYDRL